MKCDELNDDDMDVDLDTEEEFISIKPSGDSSKDLGDISVQQQQRCYTPQHSQTNADDMDIDLDTEEEFISIAHSGDSSKNLSDSSQITENIKNRVYTLTKYCRSRNLGKNLRKIVDESSSLIDGYVWCIKCHTVLLDSKSNRASHNCSNDLKRTLAKKSVKQPDWIAERLAITNQIENGTYTLTDWYTTKKYVSRIMRRILKADKTLVAGYVFCNQCRTVFTEYASQQNTHPCYRDLKNATTNDSTDDDNKNNKSNIRRCEIVEKLEKGIYTLAKHEGRSYVWILMRQILKEDGTYTGYACCIKCGTVHSSNNGKNLHKHRCCKEIRKSIRENSKDEGKDEDDKKAELCAQIAQKIQQGIYTLIERKRRGYIWKIIKNIQRDDKTLVKGYVFCIECRNVYCLTYVDNLYAHKCCKILKESLLKKKKIEEGTEHSLGAEGNEIAKKIAQGIYTVTSMKSRSYLSKLMKLILKEDKTIYKDYVFCIKCRKVYFSLNTSNLYQHKCYKEFKRSIFKKRAEEDDGDDEDENISRQDSDFDENWRIADQDFSSSKGVINDKSFTNSEQDEDEDLPWDNIKLEEPEFGYTMTGEQVIQLQSNENSSNQDDLGQYSAITAKDKENNVISDDSDKNISRQDSASDEDWRIADQDFSSSKGVINDKSFTNLEQDDDENLPWDIIKIEDTEFGCTITCEQVIKLESDEKPSNQDELGQDSIIKTKDTEYTVINDDEFYENISRPDSACDEDWRIEDLDVSSFKGVINDKSFTTSEQDEEELPWDITQIEGTEFGYTITCEQVIPLESDKNSSDQDDLGQDSAINTKDEGNTVISDDNENISRQDSACDEDWRIADQDFSSSKGVINDKSFTNSEHDKDKLHWDNIKLEEPEFGYTVTGDIVIELESDENSSNQDDIGQGSAIKTKDKGNTVSVEDDNDNRSRQDSACDEDWRIADIDFSSSKGMINDKSFTNSEQDKEDLPWDNIKIEDTELGCTMTGEQVIGLESDENSSNQDDLGHDSAIKTNDKGNTVRSDDADADDDNISHKDSACDEDWRIEDAQLNNRKTITISNEVYTISQKRKNRCPIWNVLAEIVRNDNSVLPGYVYCRRCKSVLTYIDLDTLNNHICCSKKDILQIEYENDLAVKKYGNNMKLIKIAENIENGLYTLTTYCGRSFVWKILRRIVDENERPVDGYAWCTKCNTVLMDYPFYRTRHKCSMILKRATEKEYLQNESKAECLAIANQIENGNYTLTYWYTTKKYVQRIMQRILKADKTLVEGYVFCNQCRRVFSEYGSQQDKHQCYRDLINDIIGDDESYAFRNNTSNLRRFDIAEKLDKGIYTLTKQQGTSYLWKIMRKILKEDKTPVEDYMCCIKCGTICSSHSPTNLNKHKCSKELRKSMREDNEDKAKDPLNKPSRSLSDEEFQTKYEEYSAER
ncbi:uncharacterized protein LOC142222317 [Haematobia irritans]|uniref:uncharacterized protein LOC142222317 n=1 Tax=Haematobia irritans TaxID=7368 RepID=UPI003F50A8A9